MRSRTAHLLVALAFLAPAALTAAAPAKPDFKLKAGAEGALCLDCHADFQALLSRPFVHTPVKSRNCVGCHNPHATEYAKLLSGDVSSSCKQCHGGIVPAAPKSEHKVLLEKGCAACHEPHAAGFKFNLVKSEKDLCAGCHKPVAEQAVKAKFKHRPIESTGCTTCHDPHGSDKAEHLLTSAVPGMCVKCHKIDRPQFAKAHQGYPVAKADCTGCHDPHGSDKKGMLYNHVHPPVAKALCGQCHEPPGSPTPLKTKQVGMTLCRVCHAEKVTAMLAKSRVHQPVVEGTACLSCHNPHASAKPGLLKGGMVQTCGKCHSDTIKRQELAPTKHAPVKDGNCTACHDAHSGDQPFMFKNVTVTDMCGTCHDWLKHSSHPMGDKFRDPRNRNLSVGCLSCHRSHGTEYKKMLPYPTATDLCTKCHENFKR